ncbi:hypothetical protein ALI144C_23465 [Actinosynnema sp. ALI-1.44]|nr:hypothetical protein ALI144C_23465 [Actinosynnema sp. ALI-1.44]
MAVVSGAGLGARRCPSCGGRLPGSARRDAVYCSTACRARHWRWERASRVRVAAIRDASEHGRARCAECGTEWVRGVEHRTDARFCSPQCRTRAWRRRREGGDPFALPSP